MAKSPAATWGTRRFQAALVTGWMALGAAGVLYARFKGIPGSAAVPVVAAFLVAYPFYLVPAFSDLRDRLAGTRLPPYLVASAVLPYLACCLGAVEFRWIALLRLVALALACGLWFVALPSSPVTDVAFLALYPAVLLGNYLTLIYVPADHRFKDLVFLGHATLIQMAVMALLVERGVPDAGYGFIPNRREWRVGILHFLYFAPIGLALAFLLGIRFGKTAPVALIVPTFAGFLWTIALSEEFLVWGVLQKWLGDWSSNRFAAMLGASASFGLIHLWFRRFPNWRWVLIAAVLGWFCGRARNQAGSIRAGMVTHALVFTAWRAFFA